VVKVGLTREDDSLSDVRNVRLVPFIQLDVLYLELDGDQLVKFVTYENHGNYGLRLMPISEPSEIVTTNEPNPGSIYRTRELREISLGKIIEVSISTDDTGDIAEVDLTLQDSHILLIAGETYEEFDGSLRFVKPDESLLLFGQPEDALRLPWYDPQFKRQV